MSSSQQEDYPNTASNTTPSSAAMAGKKKKLHHHRVSLLTFSDEVLDKQLSQEIDPFADCCQEQSLAAPLQSVKANRRRSSILGGGGGGRRRSSIGGGGGLFLLSEAEQKRIAEMYQTVIRMSSENKLNEKNSWSFDLIDHMSKLIRDGDSSDSTRSTVNFQKASCTLDASVKIYSNRVDDTYASSHRILESLSRGGGGGNNQQGSGEEVEQQQEEEEEGGSTSHNSKGSRHKTTSSLALLSAGSLTETLERDVAHLNMAVDDEVVGEVVACDPLFQQMTTTKGLLVYNMRLLPASCSLAFLHEGIEQTMREAEKNYRNPPPPTAPPAPPTTTTLPLPNKNVISMADLIARSSLTAEKVQALTCSERLKGYQQVLGRWGSSPLGLPEAFPLHPVNSLAFRPVTLPAPIPLPDRGVAGGGGGSGYTTADNSLTTSPPPPPPPAPTTMTADDDDALALLVDGEELFTANFDDDDYEVGGGGGEVPRESLAGSASGTVSRGSLLLSPIGPTKLPWQQHKQEEEEEEAKASLLALQIDGQNDYRYLRDLDPHAMLNTNNAWAGARHWKYATRSLFRKPTTSNTTEVEAEVGEEEREGKKAKKGKTASKKGKKDSEGIVTFSLERVDPKLFASSSSSSTTTTTSRQRRDPTLSTAAAERKMESEASLLLLPEEDERLTVKALCRLHTLPHLLLSPAFVHLQVLLQLQTRSTPAKAARGGGAGGRWKAMLGGGGQGVEEEEVVGSRQKKVVVDRVAAMERTEEMEEMEVVYDNYDMDDDHGGDYATYEGGAGGGGGEGYSDGVDPTASSPLKTTLTTSSSSALLQGLQVDTSKFVQAQRLVNKLQINYAKVSKRVNVAKLKEDLWEDIDNHLHLPPPPPPTSTTSPTQSDEATLSFQQLLREAHSEEKAEKVQKDASLAYYFICLLHLANEKNLKITGQEDMADLHITQDSSH